MQRALAPRSLALATGTLDDLLHVLHEREQSSRVARHIEIRPREVLQLCHDPRARVRVRGVRKLKDAPDSVLFLVVAIAVVLGSRAEKAGVGLALAAAVFALGNVARGKSLRGWQATR